MPTRTSRPRLVAITALGSLLAVGLTLASCTTSYPGSPGGGASSTTGAQGTTTSTGTPRGGVRTTLPDTEEVAYYPFTPLGTADPSLSITRTVSGTCTGDGVAGADSYRCFAHPSGEIFDPCFSPPRASSGPLLCVPAPNVTDVVAFDAGALAAASPRAPLRLWAMELADGQVCVLVDAAWSGLGPFACPAPTARGSFADCHPPVRGASAWSAACQNAETASSPFTTVLVHRAWN